VSQTFTDVLTSFNGGELSRRMEGRVDTAIYKIGAAQIENFVLSVEGPIIKAPGFRYIRAARAGAAWLSKFVFSRTQSYLLEHSDGTIRFYTNGGRIESDPVTPYEVTVPYSAAEASAVSRQQSKDRQYLAHRKYPPAALSRTSATTFSYAALALVNGPFEDQNIDESKTITVAGTTTIGGTVTLTASAPIFAATDVGGLFQVQALDFSTIQAWQVGIAGVNAGDIQRSDGKAYTALTTGRTGTVPPTHSEGSEWDGNAAGGATDVNGKGPYGVQWAYRHDHFGIVRITGFTNSTTVTATVLRRIPDSVTSVPTWRWNFGAFSDTRGYPNVVLKWNERLILIRDLDIFGGVSGDTLNFAAFTSSGQLAADMAFRYRLSAPDPILWAADAGKYMLVGTASGEYPIGALNSGAAAGPGNLGVIGRPSNYGSSLVWPIQIGNLLNFVQRGARRVREAQYDFTRDAIVAPNSTIWCRQMTRSGVRQISYMQQPEELLFALRNDGQVAAHAYSPDQQVRGWSRRIHGASAYGGRIVSLETIPAEDGNDDEAWALVDDGAGNLSVEQMQPFFDEDEDAQTDQYFVDSGLTATFGSPATHVSGLTWLAGKPVAVLADGAVVAGITVEADGSFDLPRPATVVTVGLAYTARLVSMRVEAQMRTGTAQGKLKQLVTATARLIASGVGLVGGSAGRTLDALIYRNAGERMDAPVPLFDGDTEDRSIGGTWDRAGQIELEHDTPTNCVVAALMPRWELSDR